MDNKNVKIGIIAILIAALGLIGYFLYSHYKADSNPEITKPAYSTIVLLETNKGTVKIGLYDDDYPTTVMNFLKLSTNGFYDGLTFHRVIAGFMIQGGDPNGDGSGGPGYEIEDEFSPFNQNLRGTLAMANKNSPNTGGSQFFINVEDNHHLDSLHPVFGEVIEGMDVVDAIASVPTDQNDKPLEEVLIISATVVQQ